MSSGDVYLREQFEKTIKELKNIKQKLEYTEKENQQLKRSIFELSSRISNSVIRRNPFIFEPAEPVVASDEIKPNNGKSSSQFSDSRQFFNKCDLKMGVLNGHTLNVSDIEWGQSPNELLSGGYDCSCKIWNIEYKNVINDFHTEGLNQCVSFHSENLVLCGTSRKKICVFDKRQANHVLEFKNNSIVNSIYAYRDGSHIVSGDSSGYLKTWDFRSLGTIFATLNEPSGKPISHISTCLKNPYQTEEPRYMAVNSYDNVLRVYDRGLIPPKTKRTLIHSLRNHKNKNWPIKSSFFQGIESETDTKESDKGDTELSSINHTSNIFLATGSVDPYIYVYDVSGQPGSGSLLQRLEGHSDKVYSVCFHPSEPILASGSSDNLIKVWVPKTRVE
ncbi:WD40 repeat-like protein [Rozella allomycis CSF55]|uniref:WD40 repeat-like protein n=1 Tax=Rozella allomycis (strain CSF55) TaxID=988480 RepID=A0A075AQV9_ROZAC|nr:hypothetical protein O9G_001450 [Rozella allomycis CSF55]RKP21904.1 WD40 repeat-like protein [Rozella allomycis CSF55]|eukprot:EPZ30977.1 hypothetical protein O9G_001450 [Rozella allomycis CSF55]